jgi:hypothetical protein
MADKDIIDFNKSQFDIMVDMLVLSGMSKDDAIVKVTKDFEDEGMVLKNRGGMMNINRMTAPLGYYRGGPARAPELDEGYDPILGNWMKEARMRQAQPPAGAVDMTGQYVAPPERPRWGKVKDLGKKGLEGIKGLGSKSINALKRLVEETIGAGAAEGSTLGDMLDTYIPILKIKIENLEAAGKDATGEKNWLEYYEDLRRRQD